MMYWIIITVAIIALGVTVNSSTPIRALMMAMLSTSLIFVMGIFHMDTVEMIYSGQSMEYDLARLEIKRHHEYIRFTGFWMFIQFCTFVIQTAVYDRYDRHKELFWALNTISVLYVALWLLNEMNNLGNPMLF